MELLKILLPYGAGVVSTVIGFALNQSLSRHRELKARYERMVSHLRAALAETEWAHRILGEHKAHLSHYKDLRPAPNIRVILPSCDLREVANFLGHLKKEFVAFPETSELATAITELQFSLNLVQNRFEFLQSLFGTEGAGSSAWFNNLRDNIASSVQLHEQVLTVAERAVAAIKSHLKKVDADFEQFKSDSPFHAVLKD